MRRPKLDELPDILDLEHLQAFLGCGYRTALSLVHKPNFPSIRLGRRWKISKMGLARWLEQAENGGK